jgi:hypothetical protein
LTGIRIEPIGEGEYFGFALDADHLFLLGDFTVTHNTLLMQQALTSVATGIPWIGKPVIRERAFGFYTEDPNDEVKRRQVDINGHYDLEAADFGLDLAWEAREGKDAVLCEFGRFSDKPLFTPLWHQLWEFVIDEGYNVVGLDPTGVIFAGNENSRVQVTAFMRELVKIAVRINGGIILSAHPSKGALNSYSGVAAWLGSARFGMNLGRPADYDPETGEPHLARVLRGLGSNYSGGLRPERLEWRDGVFMPADAETTVAKRGPLTHTERGDLEYRLLAGVKRVMQNGGKVTADDASPHSMPLRARRNTDPTINRVALNDLNLAVAALVDSGRLVRVTVARHCCLRPHDGPYYPDETPWLDLRAPPAEKKREAAD